MELSSASLPSDSSYDAVRQQLHLDIGKIKSQINASKPIGLRLTGAAEALDRAKERMAQAETFWMAAQKTRELAAARVPAAGWRGGRLNMG